MVMDTPTLESLPPPPGVIGSLRAGFDAIASHFLVILLPLALDLWLWLGPHLSLEKFFKPILGDFSRIAGAGGVPVADVENTLKIYVLLFHKFNLFSILRTFPIGVFSLMTGRMPLETPFGEPMVWQVNSAGGLLANLCGFTLAGWLGGGLFFYWVSAIVTPRQQDRIRSAHAVLQTAFFSLVWAVVLFFLGMPIILVMYLLVAVSSSLAQGVLLFLGFLFMWLLVPLFFSPHGIFVKKQNALVSIVNSVRMARFTLPTSGIFVLSTFLLGIGLNFLWSVPPENSWTMLVGIFGHAFVTTALLAASFIYYRDMNAWLEIALDRFKTNATTRQV
jgi:hypothetical protein